MNKWCQSCGMPMKQDANGGGSLADGTITTEYCSDCFVGGKFTQPDFTAEDMQQFCFEKITACKIPKFMARMHTKKIPALGRWTNS